MVRVFLCGAVTVSTELEDITQFMPDAVAHETGQQKTRCRTICTANGCLNTSHSRVAAILVKEPCGNKFYARESEKKAAEKESPATNRAAQAVPASQ